MINRVRSEIPITLQQFIETIGISTVTAWRWRQRGWLRTINIAGRVYITPEALAEFNQRAEAGEFAQKHKTPWQDRAGVIATYAE